MRHIQSYLIRLTSNIIDEIGGNVVLQLVIYNAVNLVKVEKELVDMKNFLFRTSWFAHCISLMLEDIKK